jgi:hypothetical protein
MRLGDAGLHQRRTKVLYPNHRLPSWLTKGVTRDRSNRLLETVTRPSKTVSQGRNRTILTHSGAPLGRKQRETISGCAESLAGAFCQSACTVQIATTRVLLHSTD